MKAMLWLAGLVAAATPLQAAPEAAAPEAAAPVAAQVPIEVFAQLPRLDTPRLSPDGSKIAAKVELNGRQVLVIVSFLQGSAGGMRAVGSADAIDINWWRWVNDDWLVVGVGATDKSLGEEYYITRTLGISADASKANKIDWSKSGLRSDDLLWVAKDGTPRILLAKQPGFTSADMWPEVIEADLSTGRTRRVAAGRDFVWDWYADGRGQVRMGFRYDDNSRRGSLLYRATNDKEFRTIARRARDAEGEIPVPAIFRADGSAVAIDRSAGHDGVYEVSLPDLTLGKKLYTLDGYDIDGVTPNVAGDALDGVRVTDHFTHDVWLDPAMKDLQANIDKSIGTRRARITSWNRDRTRFLVEVGSPAQAGGIYFLDLAVGKLQHFAWNNDWLKGRALSPVSTVRYAARDGTPIEAVLTLPRGRVAKGLPLIVMPHGGPVARDAEGWDWWTQFLADRGYAVIQPNYRGSAGYGTAFEKKGEGEWGGRMQDDLDDAIGWAAKEGIADPKRVCIVGASYGGYAAMRAAQRDGDKYRCAISYAGVSDLALMRRYDGGFLNGKTRSDWLRRAAPDFRSVSPRFGAAGFGAPILLMHGREDRRVPVKQSRMMAEALKAAGKPYDYVEQPLGDHHFSRAADRLDFLRRMEAFLAKHNPA